MSKKRPRSVLHRFTRPVHEEVSGQTPIIPQRNEQVEGGRKRVLEARERVGEQTDRELLKTPFPPEVR